MGTLPSQAPRTRHSIYRLLIPDNLLEYLVTTMKISKSLGSFNRQLQRAFRDLRDVMRVYLMIFTFSHTASTLATISSVRPRPNEM